MAIMTKAMADGSVKLGANDADKLVDMLKSAAKMQRDIRQNSRGNTNRTISDDAANELANDIWENPHGVKIITGGTDANALPATTAVIAVGWYTRTDEVTCVRVIHGFANFGEPNPDIEGWMEKQFGTVGILFYSPTLRELHEFLDVPTGDGHDALRKAIHADPASVELWGQLAEVLADVGEMKVASKLRERIHGFA